MSIRIRHRDKNITTVQLVPLDGAARAAHQAVKPPARFWRGSAPPTRAVA